MAFDEERTSYGGVVKALDLTSNGQKSAWVRTPLLVVLLLVHNENVNFCPCLSCL